MAVPGERFPDPETQEVPDYEALGAQWLAERGIDPSFGAIAVTTGDDKNICLGTMAEAIGRHGFVRSGVEDVMEDAAAQNISLEEAAAGDRSFNRLMMRDDKGVIVRAESTEQLKKN